MKPNLPDFARNPEKTSQLLADRVDELRREMSESDPDLLAENSGATYIQTSPGKGEFRMPLWKDRILLSYPDFSVRFETSERMPGMAQQALILYYLQLSDGTLPRNEWVSFADLPGGRFYNQAYQGYTGQELRRVFQSNRQAFAEAAMQMGGSPISIGDAAYTFQLFPRVALLAVMWLGDEDFPSSYQVLFDASASHYLPIDACAIAGSMLVRQLIKDARMDSP